MGSIVSHCVAKPMLYHVKVEVKVFDLGHLCLTSRFTPCI
jgi:hypothetical protein